MPTRAIVGRPCCEADLAAPPDRALCRSFVVATMRTFTFCCAGGSVPLRPLADHGDVFSAGTSYAPAEHPRHRGEGTRDLDIAHAGSRLNGASPAGVKTTPLRDRTQRRAEFTLDSRTPMTGRAAPRDGRGGGGEPPVIANREKGLGAGIHK